MAEDWTKERVDEVIAALRAGKYPESAGEIVPVVTARGLFVLRTPTHAEYTMFRKQAVDEASRHLASESIITTIACYPDNASVLIRKWPGLAQHKKIQAAFSYLTGLADDLEGKG